MHKKLAFSVIMSLSLLFLLISSQPVASSDNQYSHLMSKEAEIIKRINGTEAYNYDLELEKIALNHSIANYSFRSAGSSGANETAKWIMEQFESFGLETHTESFEFVTWNLPNQPILVIDDDGNTSTTEDQKIISSFQSAHYSWPTPEGGIFSDIVVLPLPEARTYNEFGNRHYDAAAWNAINTTGKILLIGKEVQWDSVLRLVYINKLKAQPPAAVIYTWWYDWMASIPPGFSSTDGRPAGDFGPYYWDLRIPVGWVKYDDGLWIRNRENEKNVSARITIPAVIGYGPYYNVVGKLQGSANPEKTIIISGHYDTVMTAGFCDNGAGTAGVIELARVFAESAKEGLYNPGYTLLFIAFAGEEIGLVGSINYLKQHENELKNIGAVVNLDCIGSDNLEIAETSSTGGLDLDELVLKAASDLGIAARLTEAGGSDQETFQDPKGVNNLFKGSFWEMDAGISNAPAVEASTALYSYPLFYSDMWPSDIWQGGSPGWAHTEYDNSTSTITRNWVEVDDLEDHIQVAGLSVLRFLSYVYNPFLMQVFSITIITSIIATVAIYLKRLQVIILLRKMYERGRDIVFFMGSRGFLNVIVLTALFLFISSIGGMKTGTIELTIDRVPRTITTFNFGFPLKMVGSLNPSGAAENNWAEQYVGNRIFVFWDGLILNVILYLIVAFGLSYLILRLQYERAFKS